MEGESLQTSDVKGCRKYGFLIYATLCPDFCHAPFFHVKRSSKSKDGQPLVPDRYFSNSVKVKNMRKELLPDLHYRPEEKMKMVPFARVEEG